MHVQAQISQTGQVSFGTATKYLISPDERDGLLAAAEALL